MLWLKKGNNYICTKMTFKLSRGKQTDYALPKKEKQNQRTNKRLTKYDA